MATSKETAAHTLASLEARLKRVDYLMDGGIEQDDAVSQSDTHGSAIARLRVLERSLHSLIARSQTAGHVLALQKRSPDLFHSTSTATAPSSLPITSLAALVLSHGQLYQQTSARLIQLQDYTVPDPSSAAKAIDLQPRIDEARAKQQLQAKEFAELRARSARLAESWYEGGVLGMDEQWAEWEERLRDAEILVRRREAAKKREEGLV